MEDVFFFFFFFLFRDRGRFWEGANECGYLYDLVCVDMCDNVPFVSQDSLLCLFEEMPRVQMHSLLAFLSVNPIVVGEFEAVSRREIEREI
jgi:hypothetical protein